MKKGIQIILMPALVLILANCSNKSSSKSNEEVLVQTIKQEPVIVETKPEVDENDLRLAKSMAMGTMGLDEAMNAIAGVRGDVNWTLSYPDEYKSNPNLFVAEVTAKNESLKREVYLKLLINRKTGAADVLEAIRNGRTASNVEIMLENETAKTLNGWSE